ncbi:MAG TPA: hypothetical protein VGV37_03695 [Aliidongia sp.]|uniref:hypothetical protein n=1 Tax=Aliidongia sp. TaxID=1914230 RepID=UPI002DDD4583|nr:hypothetical protein [Aliidongia sp.]HEV2673619.1 hypothetical protein [Aliidongia sp.]
MDDVTLALGLGRPVFLLGPAGSGKTALADQIALRLTQRYGVARVEGRPDLALDDVVAACRRSFAAGAWDLASGDADAWEPVRPGNDLVIVDRAEAVSPALIEQLVAASSGSSGVLPSHRILFAGRETVAEVIDAGHVRNHWGAPVVVELAPWRGDAVAPFLRFRLQVEGLDDPDRLSDAAIRTVAAEADGNPGHMLDLARRALRPVVRDLPDRIEPSTEPVLPPGARRTTITKLAAAERPPRLVLAEPPARTVLALRETEAVDADQPTPGRRRMLRLGLPVFVVAALGCLVWVLDWPLPLGLLMSQQVAVAAPPAVPIPVPVALPPVAEVPPVVIPTEAPSAAPILAEVIVPAPAVVEPPVTPTAAPEPPPPAVVSAVAPAAVPAIPRRAGVEAPSAPAIPVGMLIARGDALLANGDFAAARLFYLQASRAGSAEAATAVARTYDPLALTRLGVVGARGEPDKAIEWYRKALDLGDPTASEPLQRLSSP